MKKNRFWLVAASLAALACVPAVAQQRVTGTFTVQQFGSWVNGLGASASLGASDGVPIVQNGQTKKWLPYNYFLSRDASNASAPNARENLKALPHLADNAALAAAATTAYPSGVVRDDYTASLGAPPLYFLPQSGACAVNSMVGDGGSCVDAANGNSWKAVHPADGLDIRQFGAPTDGTSDSRAAIQAAINYARTFTEGGPPVVFGGGLKYTVTDTVDAYPSVDLTLVWKGGALLMCNMTGADKICLKATHPTAPTTRGQQLILRNPRLDDRDIGSSSVGPILFQARNPSGLKITGSGEFNGFRNNTVVSMSSCWNCDLGPTSVWGAGYNWRYKDASAATFSIATGTTALSASLPGTFSAGDVGHAITVRDDAGDGNNRQLFIVGAFVDDQHVTTTNPAVTDWVAGRAFWDGAKGSIGAGGTTLTLDASVAVASDVGRVVYVTGAGSPIVSGAKSPLRAKVVSITAPNVVELDTAATTAVTGEQVMPSPAVDLWSFDGNTESTNDLRWDGPRIPPFRGVGLVAYGGALNRITNGKIHGCNAVNCLTASDAQTSTYHMAVMNGTDWTFDLMMFEGQTANPRGTHYVSGNTGTVHFGSNNWSGVIGQPFVYMEAGRSSANVVLGDLATQYPSIGEETISKVVTKNGVGEVRINGTIRGRNYELPRSITTAVTADGSYTIPVWASRLKIQAVGQGGGGGSGASGADANNRFGGVGGNGGSWSEAEFRTVDITNSSLTIDVGDTGGTGGAGVTGGNGNAGTAGADTTIKDGTTVMLIATGGTQGAPGGTTAGSVPVMNWAPFLINQGAANSVTGTPSAGSSSAAGAPGGGGAGGGKDTTPTPRAGSAGGFGYHTGGANKKSAGGTGGAVGGTCTAGGTNAYVFGMGGGGGGGAASIVGDGGAGCAGGVPGGGGGAGGASPAANASGAGGAGARGEVRITAYRN